MKSFQEWLNEAPYLMTDGTFTMKRDKVSSMSPSAIDREYELLAKAEVSNVEYGVFLRKSPKNDPIIRIISSDKNEDGRYEVLGQVVFKSSPLKIKGAGATVQVDGIEFSPKIREAGLASKIYRMLVQRGYTLVSDSTQFKPGAGIWEKLASEASKTGMTVRIYDDRTKEFISKNGKPVHYDGSNLKDDEIWTTGWDFDGEHILLVMT